MECLECGNCRGEELAYYCTAKDDFIIKETISLREKHSSGWKKGDPRYENRRRTNRGEKEEAQKTG